MSGRDQCKNREHVARLQRQRRERMTRIDYMPSAAALVVIGVRRARERPGSVAATHSAVIDAILSEWAELVGINKQRKSLGPTGPIRSIGPTGRMSASARAYESCRARPELLVPSRPRAPAYECGADAARNPKLVDQYARVRMTSAPSKRVTCGATRHRDRQPCQAKSEPGKQRCRFHGGRSTGPRTQEGKKRALANLRQNARGI